MIRLSQRPRLSVVVVVFRMRAQAMNTLYSLSVAHQRSVRVADYEIIVVENASDEMLDPAAVSALGPNFRYLRRREAGVSPAPAINAGARLARGTHIAVAIDGARMLTPGAVRGLLDAQRIARTPVVSVPGYHLGDQLHSAAATQGYSAAEEQAWLAQLDWRSDGYRLFSRAVLSASCSNGFLMPMAESNCVAVPRRLFTELGGFDEAFVTSGGGFVNLDFYRRAVLSRGAVLVVLPGEGAFHQFHGGATTATDHDESVAAMRAEYQRLRGADYSPPEVPGVLLGEVHQPAARFVEHSARVLQAKVSV